MKTITVVVPVYNEEANIRHIYERVNGVFKKSLPSYECKLLFIDNCSTDNTRSIIEEYAASDTTVQAIYNAKNFGFVRSSFYGLTRGTGDAVVLLYADLQDPPELIPEFVNKWEEGNMIVVGVKKKSLEKPVMYFFRKCYYALINRISEVEQIEQYDGFGLYDRSFIMVLRELDDPMPYLRGIIAELGYKRTEVEYVQDVRKHGKSKWGFLKLYDFAFLGITSYSKTLLRVSTFLGFFVAICSLLVAAVTFIQKLMAWNSVPVGAAAITIGVFFLGAVQLIFIGIMGEYIMNINIRTIRRPLVIEEKRINMEECDER